MKAQLHALLALLAVIPTALFSTGQSQNCDCRQGTEIGCGPEGRLATDAHPDKAPRYVLKGVIVAVQADQSALLVKHEAIPGLMPAMTMLFKVDAATLKAAVKGQRFTATLVQRDDDFWLEDVKPAP
jgi:Cu/Ag efflux protein CusF